jgi:hypothetical protein
MKTRLGIAAVLVVGGLLSGCSADDKEVGEVETDIPLPTWYKGPRDQPFGATCTPLDEYEPTFSGFGLREVNVEDRSPTCASQICLVNHFQGRVSCPYGQNEAGAESQLDSPPCLTPDGGARVLWEVEPQLVDRRPEDAAYCSCHCGGPEGSGPFCACPSGFECVPLVPFGLGMPDDPSWNLQGSYCIKAGTAYDPNMSRETCDWATQSCGPA